MIVERTSKEILLKISSKVDKFGIERVLEYIEYLELTSGKKKATQEDADNLADELNENWWNDNKDRFIK
jgi:predicted trehalose synthase